MDHFSDRRVGWTLVVGILMLAVGVLLLLDNFDVIYIGKPVSHFWPLIIVAIGVGKLAQAETRRERRTGFSWIFIGVWFLVSVLHMFGLTFHNSWPLLLIGLGINAIWKAMTVEPESRLSKG
jgi:hypothetical protein